MDSEISRPVDIDLSMFYGLIQLRLSHFFNTSPTALPTCKTVCILISYYDSLNESLDRDRLLRAKLCPLRTSPAEYFTSFLGLFLLLRTYPLRVGENAKSLMITVDGLDREILGWEASASNEIFYGISIELP